MASDEPTLPNVPRVPGDAGEPTQAVPPVEPAGRPLDPTTAVPRARIEERVPPTGPRGPVAGEETDRSLKTGMAAIAALVVAAIVVLLLIALADDDDGEDVAGGASTTAAPSTSAPTTAAPSTEVPAAAPTTAAPTTTEADTTTTAAARPARATFVNEHPEAVVVVLNGRSVRLGPGERSGPVDVPAEASAGGRDDVEARLDGDRSCTATDSGRLVEPGESYVVTVSIAAGTPCASGTPAVDVEVRRS